MSEVTEQEEWKARAMEDGYVFECTCGELYSEEQAAWQCKKCRKYLGHSCQSVYNIQTEEWFTHEEEEPVLVVSTQDTHWINKIGDGAKVRGMSLIHTQSGDILGHAEPYRGGGSQYKKNGNIEYKKGWWVTILNAQVSWVPSGDYAKEHCTHRATLKDAENAIRDMKGLSHAD